MDYYPFVKFLHVLFVIIWLGGGFGLVILAVRAERTKNGEELADVIQHVIFMANRVFVPSALAALVCGIVMVIMNWSFGDLWILIGLAGFALTFGTGIAVLKPRSDKVGELIKRAGVTPTVVEQSRHILWIAEFDFVMLFIVVANMVLKPTIDDTVTLIVMAVLLVVAAVYFLGGLRSRPIAASAG